MATFSWHCFGNLVGTLVAYGDTEDALKAGLMGGIAGYGSKFLDLVLHQLLERHRTGSAANISGPEFFDPTTVTAEKQVYGSGIMSTLKDFATSPVGIATLGATGLTALSGGLEEEPQMGKVTQRPYPVGKTRLGTGLIDGKTFNLDDEEERAEYFKTLRKRQSAETLADGGEVEGPGTGTSDSVQRMLSDGDEATAKAVRGAGGGDRDVGAARMYDMMSELERVKRNGNTNSRSNPNRKTRTISRRIFGGYICEC